MRTWLVDIWLQVRASYWFIPSVMSFAALAAALLMVHLDNRFGDAWLESVAWLHATRPDGARALLSTVAGSMITVAGVTFSMTLLAVSHASAQIGPRLLTEFMRDRGNQFTLGTFIATFLYCLMVLRTVRTDAGSASDFVPDLAILAGLVLTVLSVMVLIYFIHHVPQSINVAHVVSRTGDQLVRGIDRLFPGNIGDEASQGPAALPPDFHSNSRPLTVDGDGGYLRVLDGEQLLELTSENDLVVELQKRPGDFAIDGHPLMRVWPAQRLDEALEHELRQVFSWGTQRTRDQDVRVPIEQLLEILAKAMSPGVNGQYTAILCIDQFERALARALRRRTPAVQRCDDGGRLRIVAQTYDHSELVDAIMAPLRQFVRNDWLTSRHFLAMIDRLLSLEEMRASAGLLRRHRDVLLGEIATGSMSAAEKSECKAAAMPTG